MHDPFKYSGIEDVADILAVTNPRVTRDGYVKYIKTHAIANLSDGCSYCGTLGFIITSFRIGGDPFEPISYKISLDAGVLKLGLKYHMPAVATAFGEKENSDA